MNTLPLRQLAPVILGVTGFFHAATEAGKSRKRHDMERFWTWIAYTFTAIVAWAAGLHSVFYGLLILQAIDVVTGVMVAIKTRTFRSAIGKAGIQRRAAAWAMILAIATFQHCTGLLPTPGEANGMGVTEWTAVAMAFMEFTSIIENAGRLGVSVPSWLLSAMEKVKTVLGLTPREPEDGGK